AVVPGREAVLLLRVVDHLAAGEPRGRTGGEREGSRKQEAMGARHDDVLHWLDSATLARRIGFRGWLRKSTTTGAKRRQPRRPSSRSPIQNVIARLKTTMPR